MGAWISRLAGVAVSAALSFVVCIASAAAADRVALVIGNGRYAWAAALANPPNDASDIGQALRGMGFDVVEGFDLSKQETEAKIREFSRKLAGAQIAAFFYAGHAIQVDGQNYLLPTDARLEKAGDLPLDTVDLQVVLRQMETQSRVNLVFIDACRDNPLLTNYQRALGPTRSAAATRGLATVRSTVGTLIAFATEPGNTALDGAGRNSPFSSALLKHIRTPGVEIGLMMRRVRADVIVATSNRQVPWEHSSLVDTVVLVPDGGNPARPAQQATATPLAAPSALPKSPQGGSTSNTATATQPQLVYAPWTKFCGKDDKNPAAQRVCLTVKEARLETGQFLAGAALIEQDNDSKRLIRVTLPLGMQMPQGVRIILDNDAPLTGRYVTCLPNGCMADIEADSAIVSRLRGGRQMMIQGINLQGQVANYAMPLADFARAYAGPPTDPKKFEEDQKKLQEELQRKAEEARRRSQAGKK